MSIMNDARADKSETDTSLTMALSNSDDMRRAPNGPTSTSAPPAPSDSGDMDHASGGPTSVPSPLAPISSGNHRVGSSSSSYSMAELKTLARAKRDEEVRKRKMENAYVQRCPSEYWVGLFCSRLRADSLALPSDKADPKMMEWIRGYPDRVDVFAKGTEEENKALIRNFPFQSMMPYVWFQSITPWPAVPWDQSYFEYKCWINDYEDLSAVYGTLTDKQKAWMLTLDPDVALKRLSRCMAIARQPTHSSSSFSNRRRG